MYLLALASVFLPADLSTKIIGIGADSIPRCGKPIRQMIHCGRIDCAWLTTVVRAGDVGRFAAGACGGIARARRQGLCFERWNAVYYLGPQRGAFRMDEEALVVESGLAPKGVGGVSNLVDE